jgi:hypothetical protein
MLNTVRVSKSGINVGIVSANAFPPISMIERTLFEVLTFCRIVP